MIISILLLAGKGTRLNKDTPKQFIQINDQELFLYPLKTLLKIEDIKKHILVVPKDDYFKVSNILKREGLDKLPIYLVVGGETRTDSTFNALKYIKANFRKVDTVLIHDAARVLVSESIIKRNIKASLTSNCITTYIDEVDTVIQSKNNEIDTYLERDKIKRIQTPQTFNFSLLYSLYVKNKEKFTDDTTICKKNKYNIKLVKGSALNFKVTTNEDLKLLEALLRK